MKDLVAVGLVLTTATGCLAVPALKQRETIRAQALWVEQNCPGTRGPFGAVVSTGTGSTVRLTHTHGEVFECAGVPVSRDALAAMGDNKIPRDPNVLEWVGAYAADAILTIVAVPLLIGVASAGSGAGSASQQTATGYTQDAYGPGVHADSTGQGFIWRRSNGGGSALGPMRPNVYGPGIGSDATGAPVEAQPWR